MIIFIIFLLIKIMFTSDYIKFLSDKIKTQYYPNIYVYDETDYPTYIYDNNNALSVSTKMVNTDLNDINKIIQNNKDIIKNNIKSLNNMRNNLDNISGKYFYSEISCLQTIFDVIIIDEKKNIILLKKMIKILLNFIINIIILQNIYVIIIINFA
uniref:Uncharacterized protein n=1 Tax=viral metagenome TaxID=1070528 RepID=A0A6C0H5T4_9ZZZZ